MIYTLCLPGLVEKKKQSTANIKGYHLSSCNKAIPELRLIRWSTQTKGGDAFGIQGARVTQGPQIALLASKQ